MAEQISPADPSRSHTRERRPRIRELGEVHGQERHDLRRRLGGLLKHERRRRRWTQAQLAEATGVRRQTINDLERGHRRPSTTTVWKIAKALRPDGTMRERVIVDERLRRAAGPSLRFYAKRTNAERDQVREQVRAEFGADVPVGRDDTTASIAAIHLILTQPGGDS